MGVSRQTVFSINRHLTAPPSRSSLCFSAPKSYSSRLKSQTNPDPNGAAAIQELLGGKFGEMSTLNNYLHQSFGFKEKKKLKPFYDPGCQHHH